MTTRGREHNEFSSHSWASPRMAARILEQSFEKRQQENGPDGANTGECNLNHHVGVFSTGWAKP